MKMKDDAVKMHRKGFNTRTISKRLGVSVAQVEHWLSSSKKAR